MIRTVIIDDAELVRQRIIEMIRISKDIECVGEASDGKNGLEIVKQKNPDIAIVDFHLRNGPDRFDLIHEIQKINKKIKIITLTNEFNHSLLLHIIQSGVSGVLIKSGSDYIIQAIHTINKDQTFLQPEFGFELIKLAETQIRFRDLSQQQFKILNKHILEGKSREITAKEIGITPKAVSNDLSRIKKTLGTKTKADLIKACHEYFRY